MQNVAYISGYLRCISNGHFCIQQTNNENQMIRVFQREGMELPSWAEEWAPAKAVCRVHGVLDKDGRRHASLTLLALDRANVLDLPPESAWKLKLPPGVPQSNCMPAQFGMEFSNSSNQVQLAGYVGAIMREPVNPYSKKRGLIILLQQHNNIDRAIQIRYRGRFGDVVRSTCPIGTALAIEGRYRVKTVPDLVASFDGKGAQPVITSTFIETDKEPFIATRETILEAPSWAGGLKTRHA